MWGVSGDDRPPRRRLSDSSFSLNQSLTGLMHLKQGDDQSESSRRDDLSLAYSVDDNKSRASTYISAASEDDNDADNMEKSSTGIPAPSEASTPDTGEPVPDDRSAFQSFIQSPLDYIFGGNDDDISTLGGFEDSFQWGDGDNSTIATTPTLKREFKISQPTIYEDEDEDRASSAASMRTEEKSASHSGSGHSKSRSASSRSRSSRSRAQDTEDRSHYTEDRSHYTEDRSHYTDDRSHYTDDRSQYTEERSRYAEDRSQCAEDRSQYAKDQHPEDESYFSEEGSQYTDEESLGKVKGSSLKNSTHSKSNRSSASVTFFEESEHVKSQGVAALKAYEFADKSISSQSSRGMTDEEASRSRRGDDEISLSLSQALSYHEEQVSRRSTDQWSDSLRDDVGSVQSSRSEVWRRNVQKNKSWRSTRSRRPSYGTGSVYSRADTMRSMMPETPQVVSDGQNGPMMTVGMSGRAVVHVKLDHASDGTIQKLAYTTPITDEIPDAERDEYTEDFNDEETIAKTVDWFDYYYVRSRFIRFCYTRKCIRISTMLSIGVALILTVVFSVMNTIASTEGGDGNSSTQRATQSSQMAINDLTPPRSFSDVVLPHTMDTHIEDWYGEPGTTAAKENEVPFYFHIPLSGALIAHRIWSHCLGFSIASDAGKSEVSNTTLKVTLVSGASFANVDVTTLEGIEHAASMGLVPSGIPDVLISHLFGDVVTKLYSPDYKTKLMITMRHPIDRAVALFEAKKKAVNDRYYDPNLTQMTLDEFALSGHIENNYVVRLLTGKYSGRLTVKDVALCKELLRRKALVGVYESLEATLSHFELYLGWKPVATDALNCQATELMNGLAEESVAPLDAGSSAYSLIRQQNLFDISLYEYVKNVLAPFQRELIKRQWEESLGFGQANNS